MTNWDFVNHLDDPERRDTVMLETRTWYGIPHSVTIGIVGRGDKLYEATVALMTDRDEVAGVMGRDPVTVERGPDGQERITAVMHYWRVFQRNVPDYSADSQGVAF